jgi:hypothetical protein
MSSTPLTRRRELSNECETPPTTSSKAHVRKQNRTTSSVDRFDERKQLDILELSLSLSFCAIRKGPTTYVQLRRQGGGGVGVHGTTKHTKRSSTEPLGREYLQIFSKQARLPPRVHTRHVLDHPYCCQHSHQQACHSRRSRTISFLVLP